jgi:uncharacterized RDD family membrane protein YckC
VIPSSVDGPSLPTGVILTPIGRRVLGALLDGVVIGVPLALALLPFALPSGKLTDNQLFIAGVASAVLSVIYHTVAIAVFGRTVGKLALSCRVVRSDDGGRIGWSAAAIRALIPSIAAALPGIGILLLVPVYGLAMVDQRRQGMHDKAAGTLVVMNATAPAPTS